MSPFGNGTPHEERRRPGDHPRVGGKRDDDPDETLARGIVRWWKWLATKRVLALALASATATAVTWVALSLTLATRVDALESSVAVIQTDVTQLKDFRRMDARNDTATVYMMCKMFERALPQAIPPRECDTVDPRR